MTIKYAEVTEIKQDGFRVTFLGESLQSEMQYYKLAGYVPIMGDKVAFIVDSKNKYLCLGKIG